ncbi:MAG TPA: CehA/McbA family metallohydrolase [Luteitalea sp.]|nr:CehA/McbA family metallohydrolase [Luteitalea sp.]
MNVRRAVLLAVVLAGGAYSVLANAPTQAPAAATGAPLRWYKGNTHTHTLNSDGDSTPDEVVKWYRDHRYDFLVLTDHNFLTDVTALNALHGADEKFLVIKGEEISSSHDRKPLHINGLDPARRVAPVLEGTSVSDVLQKNIDAIRAANGVPHINHPNFGWAIGTEDLAAVRNTNLFEVFNAHPMVNNEGGSGHPSLEQTWDALLSRGIRLFGLATDDAHEFKKLDDLSSSRPGIGWVAVRAEKLEARAIVAALDRGDFYASTGVEIADYRPSPTAIAVDVKPHYWVAQQSEGMRAGHRIEFIGKGGAVLQMVEGDRASYTIKGTEGYVRARVTRSDGKKAWLQPVMLGAQR